MKRELNDFKEDLKEKERWEKDEDKEVWVKNIKGELQKGKGTNNSVLANRSTLMLARMISNF